jgi:hypothetical protein
MFAVVPGGEATFRSEGVPLGDGRVAGFGASGGDIVLYRFAQRLGAMLWVRSSRISHAAKHAKPMTETTRLVAMASTVGLLRCSSASQHPNRADEQLIAASSACNDRT